MIYAWICFSLVSVSSTAGCQSLDHSGLLCGSVSVGMLVDTWLLTHLRPCFVLVGTLTHPGVIWYTLSQALTHIGPHFAPATHISALISSQFLTSPVLCYTLHPMFPDFHLASSFVRFQLTRCGLTSAPPLFLILHSPLFLWSLGFSLQWVGLSDETMCCLRIPLLDISCSIVAFSRRGFKNLLSSHHPDDISSSTF